MDAFGCFARHRALQWMVDDLIDQARDADPDERRELLSDALAARARQLELEREAA